jgi:hypothetical protein
MSRRMTAGALLWPNWLAIAAVTVAGCNHATGNGGDDVVSDYSRVRSMSAFYQAYLTTNRGQPPRDEQAFRTFLTAKEGELQKVGLTIEQMFTSPRDDRPFKWVYGMKPPPWRQKNITCYGYEVEPTNGKRLVVGSRGMYDEIDESQFRSLFPKSS